MNKKEHIQEKKLSKETLKKVRGGDMGDACELLKSLFRVVDMSREPLVPEPAINTVCQVGDPIPMP